ncbi:MAG: hypothetical protein JWO80_3915 [Bryobacterales bacterium]|nr:hypothetical protein [Bryobacterales bacterium]
MDAPNSPHVMPRPMSRREALARVGAGFGLVGLGGALGSSLQGASIGAGPVSPLAPKQPQFAPKAKRVIYLFLSGGVSHIDTFDRKTLLDKYDGKPLPYETPATQFATGNLMRSPFEWKQYGQNGTWVSELFPKVAPMIDDFCLIRSMYTDIPNHPPGQLMMTTGFSRPGRPSMGSWVTYGLGSENQNLPAFIVLAPGGDNFRWSAGFLPAVYQGTLVSDIVSDPQKQVQYLSNSRLTREQQRRQLDLIQQMNHNYLGELGGAPELEATIQSMETAFTMQTAAPEVFDIRKESKATLDRYGDGDFARGCLMARRLVEAGVRMVQVYYGVKQEWDQHEDIMGHKVHARNCDPPIAALIQDLKERGLLDDTLVIVGTEFGRTPVLNLGGFQSIHNGRDHNHYGFSVLLAGGGVKPGLVYGATDEFGFKATENPVHVHDLHATCLHLLGFDHEKLTYRYSGRDFRLTDVGGNVVRDILA